MIHEFHYNRFHVCIVLQIVTDPCSEYYVHAYMNRKDVQEALHANVTNLNYDWESCSDVITKWVDSASTVLPILHELLNNSIRVWIFR